MAILKVEDLNFTYPLCKTPALDSVSFEIERGDFCVVCGATGSGKSTLLRLLKREIAPLAQKSGNIYFDGVNIDLLSHEISSSRIGFVMQDPEHQIVTDKVWHELAFGLENLGVPQSVIARRVAEMANYFGIESWFDKRVSELSGGQKQLLSLASVMVCDPDVLILDEPCAQLDPIASSDFISTLKKLSSDLSLTVIIVEHRLEELIPICDKLLVLEGAKLLANGDPKEVIAQMKNKPAIIGAMPAAARLYHALDAQGECPLSVKEGRRFIEKNYNNDVKKLDFESYEHSKSPALEFCNAYFRYEKNSPDTLRGLDLKIYENEIFCILGGNGSGKSTSLRSAAGLLKLYSGCVKIFGQKLKDYPNGSLYKNCLSLLPQDVQTVFSKNTVKEELDEVHADLSLLPFNISHLCDKHPYDLSGGEMQLAALAKVLAAKPKILLMDEPTKGIDSEKKSQIIDILKKLKESGVTVVIVTHDVEFTALCADRCALFFRGQTVSVGTPREFFSQNKFYTTAACRMTKGFFDNAVTVEDTAKLCRLNSRKRGGERC